ncbi:MAG: YidC/Oxa1 family membrane protein insertase [Tumebacillaceae bacterium]
MLRRMNLPLLVLLIAITVTGCGAKVDASGHLDRSNVWGKFVGIVSDGLDYFFRLTGDYGFAILIVTLIVRLIIFPLMMKQIRYQKAMQAIQPELKAIRDKYKDDKEKINQETMKLFQQYGANPLSGCFPIIIQMPVLFALYQAINTNFALKHHEFLGFLPLSATHTTSNAVLAVLAAASTFLQNKMTMTSSDPNARMMIYITPLMIGFFTWQFPAALGLYWFTSNILSIIQTYFTKGIRNAPAPVPAAGGKKK